MLRRLSIAVFATALAAGAVSAQGIDTARLTALRYRTIGPSRGGRVTAVAGHRRQLCTFYMGATGGGVWKTADCGISWRNVSDGYFATPSIGAIAVADSNPDVVYVGTGSAAIRSNVIQGRGVYKSTDAGRTWTFIGLPAVGQIGAIRVHPRNPDIAFVAAVGQPFGPNPDRGVYRTRDGGKTWQKVLFINDHTGVVSLAMDPQNPNEIYAGAWRAERKPWTIISGGPASETGLYKSIDGGDTWTHLTNGLPRTLIGKIHVDVPAANPRRVYVILEAPAPAAGVYRSDDGGASFVQVNSDPELIARPFYYTYIDADPKNPDVVWVNNLGLWKSEDGGHTFRRIAAPHGDMHGMWINPDNTNYIIQSNDGGANVSTDGGRSWSTQDNQPTGEMYGVEVDDQFPYRVYGAQQDTGAPIIVPSDPWYAGRLDTPFQLWLEGPGCETGPVKPKPGTPQVIYGVCKGEFSRLNLATGQESNYWIYPQNRYGHNPNDMKFRFQRTSPFEISPSDPNVIYHGSQFLHRTTDEGRTWEIISPDLTAHEPDKQVISGEPITRDITGEEVYSTIFAIEESPLEKGVIWVGANDGPVHVTRDAGKTWTDVTPKMPPGGRVQNIEASPHRKGSAYVAINRSQLDDWQPYIYRTDDYGATWTRLTDGANGIANDFPARVVREDPAREGLLYAGTEFGIFVSFDNGTKWQSLQLNLPVTPVTDIKLHNNDLVLSTMGRAFWILDNVTPLQQLAAGPTRAANARGVHLLQPRTAIRARWAPMGGPGAQPADPEYPPPAAQIDYTIDRDLSGDLSIEILGPGGDVLRTFSSGAPSATAPATAAATPTLTKNVGLNRLSWDMRIAGPLENDLRRSGRNGPYVPPGTYQVRLRVEEVVEMRSLQLAADPRLAADGITTGDLQAQFEFNTKLVDAISDARRMASTIRRDREELETRSTRAPSGEPRSAGATDTAALLTALKNIESKLVTAGGAYPQPMLIDQLLNVYRMTNQADQKLGRDAAERFNDLRAELRTLADEFERLEPKVR